MEETHLRAKELHASRNPYIALITDVKIIDTLPHLIHLQTAPLLYPPDHCCSRWGHDILDEQLRFGWYAEPGSLFYLGNGDWIFYEYEPTWNEDKFVGKNWAGENHPLTFENKTFETLTDQAILAVRRAFYDACYPIQEDERIECDICDRNSISMSSYDDTKKQRVN